MWLVRRDRWKWVARAGLLGLGYVLGATGAGALLGLLGSLVGFSGGKPLLIVLLAIGSLVLVRETVVRSIPVPQARWQVPQWWLQARYRGALAFGLAVGAGPFTYQPSALFHLYLVGELVSGSAATGALMGAVYGSVLFAAFCYGTIAWRSDDPQILGRKACWIALLATWVGAFAAPFVVFVPGSGLF